MCKYVYVVSACVRVRVHNSISSPAPSLFEHFLSIKTHFTGRENQMPPNKQKQQQTRTGNSWKGSGKVVVAIVVAVAFAVLWIIYRHSLPRVIRCFGLAVYPALCLPPCHPAAAATAAADLTQFVPTINLAQTTLEEGTRRSRRRSELRLRLLLTDGHYK